MAKTFYCVRFCQGIDDDDLNLVTLSATTIEDEIDFEIVALACEGCDGASGLYHAHFTAPIACASRVAKAAAQHQLDPSAVLELCKIALAYAYPKPSDATI